MESQNLLLNLVMLVPRDSVFTMTAETGMAADFGNMAAFFSYSHNN